MNPVCPYCRTEFEEAPLECPGCGTPHHSECFAENGGCTVFGCSAAPAAEAKISVAETELAGPPRAAVPSPLPARSTAWLGSGSVLGSISRVEPAESPAPGQESSAALPTPPPPLLESASGAAPPPMPSPRGVYAPLLPAHLFPPAPRKKRVQFVLLAIFLGMFGAHNFYAGYTKKGFIQICFTVLTCFYAAVVSWVWAIVEACTVNTDADGEQFT
ncbi:MAG: NINE protein [Candidatus Acidiferrum sp.]